MSLKIAKFNAKEMEREFFSDSSMVGVVCSLPAYHLCWQLNNHLGAEFRCEPGMTIDLKENDVTSYFAVYQYLIPESTHECLLYKVKNGATFLLPRVKEKKSNWLNNIDYLLLLKTADHVKDARDWAAQLSAFDFISFSAPVESGQFKHLENLLV